MGVTEMIPYQVPLNILKQPTRKAIEQKEIIIRLLQDNKIPFAIGDNGYVVVGADSFLRIQKLSNRIQQYFV